MASLLSLPIARLRGAGCKVHTIIGHNPYTTGSHPAATSRWQYGIELPEGVKIPSIEDALWRYNRSWDDVLGEATAHNHRDGRILVQAFAKPDPKATKPAQVRAGRHQVEREIATLMNRIASVVDAKVQR